MGCKWRYIGVFFCFSMVVVCAHAQEVQITGEVVDSLGSGIPNVSITYKTQESQAILGYTVSGTKGVFRLIVSSKHDSISLTVSHLGYQKQSRTVLNRPASYTFTLAERNERLREVQVAPMPVYRRNDTINYAVDAFTAKQDRVIADIIQKLPGVEMEGDRILYQGKSIQKYMVNNLDLMEGRYAMVNKNLPADAVKRVQIIENHQPIKILDSIVFSDRASLNLELKKFTTTGTGKLGAGYTPMLWEGNLTPMTFGKTFQALYSAQSNNIGDDVSKQLRTYYTGGSFSMGSSGGERGGPSFLGLQGVSTPGFDEKKWLDNRIFLASANMLQKLADGMELKGNLSFFNDTQRREGYTYSQLFTPDSEVLISENVMNTYRTNNLTGGFLLEKNEKEVYLRNDARVRRRWNRDVGQLLLNTDQLIAQHRNYDDLGLSNNLSMKRFIGSQLVSVNSSVDYGSTPQRLRVLPGRFADLLNRGEDYDETTQDILYRHFATSNSLGFIRKVSGIQFSPTVNLGYEWNRLESQIGVVDKAETVADGGEGLANNLHTARLDMEGRLGMLYETGGWRFSLNLPYSVAIFGVRQFGETRLNGEFRNAFNPSASARLKWNSNNELTVRGAKATQFGGLSNFYDGYIISSYRNISRYRSRILQSGSWNSGADYRYGNTLAATFVNASYSYSRGKRDYAYQTALDANGQTTISVEDVNSGNWTHSFGVGGSRFFHEMKTVFKLNGNTGFGASDYLLNGVMSKRRYVTYGASFEANNTLLDMLSFTYRSTLNTSAIRLAGGASTRVLANQHYLDLSVYLWENHSLTWNNAYYWTDIPGQRNQLFVDMRYRWTVSRWKVDLEASCINLLDNDRYIRRFNTEYSVIESYFDLRPRQFLVSANFRF